MKNQTGRKIEVLWYDHDEVYKDSFLQFVRTMVLRPTSQMENSIARDVNRALLEKVWYLLSNASLDKSFWAEATEYVSHCCSRFTCTQK